MIENQIDDHFIRRDEKFYSVNQITYGTFLGGPFAAAYLLSQNALHLNKTEEYKKYFFGFAFLGLSILGLIIFSLKQDINLPNYIIPLAYTLLAKSFAQTTQKNNIDKLIIDGATYYSHWRTIGISILALLLFVIIYFGLIMLLI